MLLWRRISRGGGKLHMTPTERKSVNEMLAINTGLVEQNAKLLEALKGLVTFIPEGWPMPLGWYMVVIQAEELIEEATP